MSSVPAGDWDGVYTTKAVTAVSWYQTSPVYSLELLAAAGIRADAPVIDGSSSASSPTAWGRSAKHATMARLEGSPNASQPSPAW